MNNNDYLSEEEQFKEILNNEEISRIKDPELRNIRSKYWGLRHQAFLDEHKIPDRMIGMEFDKIKAEEMKELNEYRQRNNKG
ncbi:MAG: hypothetical protein EOM50_07660 [Erysipelotrichia bacterium]|nr:hypothetical protein [Erysipelotrichia bacterium]